MPCNVDSIWIVDSKALDAHLISKGIMRNSTKWHTLWFRYAPKFKKQLKR